MTSTLQPVLHALGYHSAESQTAVVKMLAASGCFGELPNVQGFVTDNQAQAILEAVTFDSPQNAAFWLHDATQKHMLRPAGTERHQQEDTPAQKAHRGEWIAALTAAGHLDDAKPQGKHYKHVLVLGATQPAVDERLDTLGKLWQDGIRFDQIHLLSSDRPLIPEIEPQALDSHLKSPTEATMMEARYYERGAHWPDSLKSVETQNVIAHSSDPQHRANTKDTFKAWLESKPEPGSVLVISGQPHVAYQDAVAKAALPPEFNVTTVGSGVSKDHLKISTALDAMTRRIDAGFTQLLEKLEQSRQTGPQLALLDPATIQTDAATYQFRSNGDGHGVTQARRFSADRWDPVLHGDPLLVHERLDGCRFVADGHHRLDLAKRLNMEGKGPDKVAAIILREADGYTALDAKLVAAYKNIARGQNNAVEAARVLKEAARPEVHKEFLPQLQMDKGNLRLSYRLSKLSDKSLDKVEQGAIPAEMAAMAADNFASQQQQDGVISIIEQKLQSPEGWRKALIRPDAPHAKGYSSHIKPSDFLSNIKTGANPETTSPGRPR